MGMYIGTTPDLQIISSANTAFGASATGLKKTRRYFGNETPFDNQHTLARISHRLRIGPNDAKKRGQWYGLLHYLDQINPNNARDDIKNALILALDNPMVVRVVFNAVLYPNNADYSIHFQQPDTTYYLTLRCPGDYGGGVYPDQGVPPPDAGEPASSKLIVRKRSAKKRRVARRRK